MSLAPPREQLDELRRLHGSVDRVASALGESRSTVRTWYQALGGSHLALVTDELRGDSTFVEEIPVITHDYSHLEQAHVYALGDVHKGAKMHDRDRWRDWLGWLYDNPETSMIGTGDFLNAAILGSKSDIYDETMTVGQAKRELRDELRPLADAGRLQVLIPGNHEDRITRAIGDCPIADVCDQLAVPYAEAAALVLTTVGDQTYRIFLKHGSGGGASDAYLMKAALLLDADIYLSAHVHQPKVLPTSFFRLEDGRLVRRHRYFCVGGSFLGMEKYSIQRGYAPSRLGAPRIFLDGRRHEVRVSV